MTSLLGLLLLTLFIDEETEAQGREAVVHHVARSVQFSRSVVSDSLRPHKLQHTRPPCPSPTPGVHSDSHPSSQWCHPAISSSVIPFSSCPQFLPASGSFPMSQLFAWGGQSTGLSALASFPPMNTLVPDNIWTHVAWFRGLYSSSHYAPLLLRAWICPLVTTFLSFRVTIRCRPSPFPPRCLHPSCPAESLGSKCLHMDILRVALGKRCTVDFCFALMLPHINGLKPNW